MGRNHMIAGAGLGFAGAGLLRGATKLEGFSWGSPPEALPDWAAERIAQGISWLGEAATWFIDWLVPVEGEGLLLWGYLALAGALFILGTLLPDVDSRKAKLGRLTRLGGLLGPHRGFTHTDWFLAVLLLVSLPGPTRVLAFLWLGAVTHAELDGWSTAGRARFWPLGSYRVKALPDGDLAVMRPSPRALHYRTGGLAEVVLVWVCVGLGVAALFWSARL